MNAPGKQTAVTGTSPNPLATNRTQPRADPECPGRKKKEYGQAETAAGKDSRLKINFTYTHTYTYIHVHIYIYIYTYTHTYIHRYTYT